uniref:Uncharacterized protein n=1 Tax=Escherichia coli TaxID=562 RepID=A0A1S7BFN0_ECOLX|nr:hypothetical protein [Escherichia coli]
MRPHFPNIQESYRISLRIHHNGKITTFRPVIVHMNDD